MSLRTNYKDDILDTDINVNRKFNIISSGGTVIQSDVEIRETTAFTQQGDSFGAADINATNAAINAICDLFYPVGSLKISLDSSFNPNTANGWHGTWERVKDLMLYAAGDNDTVGEIVGSNTHSITVDEMPSHTHSIPALSGSASGGNHRHKVISNQDGGTTGLQENGHVAVFSSTIGPQNYTLTNSYVDANFGNSGASGNLSLSVTTNASTTGSKGSGSAMDLRSRRLNCYIWKRVS